MENPLAQIKRDVAAGNEGGTYMNAGLRYVVGVTKQYYPTEYITEVEKIDWEVVEDYLDAAYCAGKAFGFWVNDGKIYFDIVQETDSLERAMSTARRLNEIAIWDSVEQKEIKVA